MQSLVKHFVNLDFWEEKLTELNLLRNWAKLPKVNQQNNWPFVCEEMTEPIVQKNKNKNKKISQRVTDCPICIKYFFFLEGLVPHIFKEIIWCFSILNRLVLYFKDFHWKHEKPDKFSICFWTNIQRKTLYLVTFFPTYKRFITLSYQGE